MNKEPPARGGYSQRVVDRELDDLIPALPAISVEGPKGVGKTATARRRSTTVFRLDDAADLERLAADPTQLRTASPPVLIDEWQRWPQVWDHVRRAVDDGASPSQFLLTGSATPTQAIHSGAGRIVPVRMRPMTLFERGVSTGTVSLSALLQGREEVGGHTDVTLEQYVDEIVRSGFPGIRAVRSDRARNAQLDGYLQRLFDHELVENGGFVRRPAAVRQWLTAYAAATATTTSLEKIRDAASSGSGEVPTKATALGYREALARLWILDPVDPWLPGSNPLARLTASPKHQLADPALAARLLSLTLGTGSNARRQYRDSNMLGQLFEALVTLDVRVYAQAAAASVGHLRTRAGEHEVDLVVRGEAGRVLALEVKLTAAPTDAQVANLHWLKRELGDDLIDMAIICTASHAYRRRDGVAVIPAALLGP